jgi:type VI secretion system protein ImpL
MDAERSALVQSWAQDVLPYCTRTTDRRYPFLRSAGIANEAPLDDFARLFAPNTGLIDRFFENRLKRWVDITNRPWRLTQPAAALGFGQSTLDMFMRAADIRDAFFPPQGGGALGFVFDATTVISGTARQTVLEIEGRNLTIEPPAQPNATFQWPTTGGVRLVLDGEEAAKIDGPWAFLRFFDRNSPQRLSDDRYNVNLTGGVRLQLRARGARNPFSVRQALDQFRCAPL